ncbi:MAG TPA: hypothetical protein VK666_31100 [Chryseolinea sp.]|nr:hypothetical protein [Chryseolinea sp.]
MESEIKKWILRWRGETSEAHAGELLDYLQQHAIQILDNQLPKMVLIAASDDDIAAARGELDSRWTITNHAVQYKIPDTRKNL